MGILITNTNNNKKAVLKNTAFFIYNQTKS